MLLHKPQPVDSLSNLRGRIERLVAQIPAPSKLGNQLPLGLPTALLPEELVDYPSKSLASFLSFLSDALPDGDVYLFGGVLRDMALFGKRGFNSDIDLVVEGSWEYCLPYLENLGASRNKFGGYRLQVSGWSIDIWKAEETWAIRQQLVTYKGIASLIETTVLNWDAILMNWRDRSFICRPRYIEEIQARLLSIVLVQNPDPLGMAVRVLRHLCLKDARQVTTSAANYLAHVAKTYSFESIRKRELQSYGNAVVELPIFRLFEHYANSDDLDGRRRIGIASDHLRKELGLEQVI